MAEPSSPRAPRSPRVPAAGTRPALVVALVAAAVAETGALLGLGGVYLGELADGRAAEPAVAGFAAGFALLVGAGLGFAAVGLWRGRRWARSPVMTWQLLQGAVAVSQLGSGSAVGAAAVGALAVAAVAAVLLVLPPVVRFTTGGSDAG